MVMKTGCYLGANMSKPAAYVDYGNFYIHISCHLRFSGQMLLDCSCACMILSEHMIGHLQSLWDPWSAQLSQVSSQSCLKCKRWVSWLCETADKQECSQKTVSEKYSHKATIPYSSLVTEDCSWGRTAEPNVCCLRYKVTHDQQLCYCDMNSSLASSGCKKYGL